MNFSLPDGIYDGSAMVRGMVADSPEIERLRRASDGGCADSSWALFLHYKKNNAERGLSPAALRSTPCTSWRP
jgi:hypothetical protein